jgi:DNA-binding transcriptional regulator LsrR (DeoR family)
MRKLTDEQISDMAEMFVFDGKTYDELAQTFGVSKSTVSRNLSALCINKSSVGSLIRQTAQARQEFIQSKEE